jgi:hypothetical protein
MKEEQINDRVPGLMLSQRQIIAKIFGEVREETIEKVKLLIAEEISICHEENTPTSRLTSLFNSLTKLI